MKLSKTTEDLLQDLIGVARAVDPSLGEQTARLAPLASGALTARLLELVTDLSAELSRSLPNGRVEVRLSAADSPELVYIEDAPQAIGPVGEDADTARLTLRLPQELKRRVEGAAEDVGVSLNSWMVARIAEALGRRSRRDGRHLKGFGRS